VSSVGLADLVAIPVLGALRACPHENRVRFWCATDYSGPMSERDDAGFADATTVTVPQMAAGELPAASYVFSIVEGPEKGRSFTLDALRPSPLLIGTSEACDVRLTDRCASRRHAALEVVGRRVRIEDLQSTNGTTVDGVMIGEAFLRGAELVRIGASALRVELGSNVEAAKLPVTTGFGRVLGESLAMRRLYPLCERLAASQVPVVIEGETGTGKELLAEAIHDASPRAGRPFVVFDCTAAAPNLIESEVFGHERGAFTGSAGQHRGVFERADGGTLLIDEIGDLPLELQPKLLRAIERAEVTRVGGSRPVHVDVRILAATRRNLDMETQHGRFRDDLFHRVAVTRVELPPLRRRRGDVTLLARHFCSVAGAPSEAIPPALLARWEGYDWPGNIRELRNAVTRWIAIGDLDLPDTPATDDPTSGGHPTFPSHGDLIGQIISLDLPIAEARDKLLNAFEQRYVDHVLEVHGGNVTRAAAASGVARRHLQRLKAKFEPR
jgi:two-component system, NtrC family, response regulator HydG